MYACCRVAAFRGIDLREALASGGVSKETPWLRAWGHFALKISDWHGHWRHAQLEDLFVSHPAVGNRPLVIDRERLMIASRFLGEPGNFTTPFCSPREEIQILFYNRSKSECRLQATLIGIAVEDDESRAVAYG